MTAAVELRMPLGYVEMDAEEMEYLEGGGIPTWLAKGTIYGILCAVGIGTGILARKLLLSQGGKYLGKKAVKRIAAALSLSISKIVCDNIVDFITNMTDPVGALIYKLDCADGNYDDWIGGKGLFTWRALNQW